MKIIFDEVMQGFISPGDQTPKQGYDIGRKKDLDCSIEATIEIDNVDEFIQLSGREAQFTGKISVPGLGQNLKIKSGSFNLFIIGKNEENGHTEKKMEYRADFDSELGESYVLHGVKHLFDDSNEIDIIQDMTTLYTSIFKKNPLEIYASGILHFALSDSLDLLMSIRVEGAGSTEEKIETVSKFFDFAYNELLEIYFNKSGFFYRTDYQNLVLSGSCDVNGAEKNFFFYGGAHDQGFPWGDEETFWDMSFILSQRVNEQLVLERYVIADTNLDKMKINITNGTFSYSGSVYAFLIDQANPGKPNYALSFSQDILTPEKHPFLRKTQADIKFQFQAHQPMENGQLVDSIPIPTIISEFLKIPILGYLNQALSRWLDKFSNRHEFGIHLGVHTVTVLSANINIDNQSINVDADKSFGEAEKSTFNFFREPTLRYNYFCGIDAELRRARVHVQGGVLYNDSQHPIKTIFDKAFACLTKPFASVEVLLENDQLIKRENSPQPLKIKNDFILEVNYDHFATGVFQRRVVILSDETERLVWALEEDMKRINLSQIKPVKRLDTKSPLDKERSKVAVFKSSGNWPLSLQNPEQDEPGVWDNLESLFNVHRKNIPGAMPEDRRKQFEDKDKKELLHKVIQETNFIASLEKKAAELGKSKDELRIAIKPNFMFLYNKEDHTTYTDPLLIEELIDKIYAGGFRHIDVVEAQSTLGEYFKNRDVRSVAKYIGLAGNHKYNIVDLTADGWIYPDPPFAGPLNKDSVSDISEGHPVPEAWADADYRISFAKNKSHCYAYYTLTMKNIYGALPYKNKFKEYHCDRDIYNTTIEYITHYPLHFGFIDAYVSADGPFGIFADKTPNYTRTIIGGENIVAVDWVGASKMGLNPMISEYMQAGVKRFGKPRIDLVGDLKDEVYEPWENTPQSLSWLLNSFLDKHHQIGNLFYSSFSNMDENAFPRKEDKWFIKLGRFLNKPIRDMFFKQPISETKKWMKNLFSEGPFS